MALLTIPDILTNPSHLNDSIADVSLEGFTIYGFKSDVQGRAGEIHELVTEADLVRTIDGAPTLTVSLTDPERRLSELNFLSYRITVILDRFAYELVQVKKSGDAFTLTFEEVVVAEMRRRNVARKVAANTMSRVEFGYLLLSELPPVDFVTPPIDLEVAHNELARGKDKPTAGQPPEDTWKALTRIFNEVKWRFWVDKGRVFAAPDTYLIGLPAAATLIERRGGVDDIDYDIDTGKRVDKATIHVLSDRWSLPVGARVDLGGVGPDAGSWIVSEIRRSLFSSQTTVTVIRPQIPLPEPPSQPDGADPQSSMLAGASGAVVGAGGAQGGGGSGVEPAVQFALSKEGGPYVWGGSVPSAMTAPGWSRRRSGRWAWNYPGCRPPSSPSVLPMVWA